MPSPAATRQLIQNYLSLRLGFLVTVGTIFYVDSGHANAADATNNGNAPNEPFATIDYAIGRCAANNGDTIVVASGHTETISAAGGISLDVAGVTIIGQGYGASRPTINLTATASTFAISAANCIIDNLLITGGIDAIVSSIVVSAADVKISNVELRDVTGQMTLGILTTAAADRLLIDQFTFRGDSAAGNAAAIALVGGDHIEIKNFAIDGNFSTSAIDIRTTATTNLQIHDGYIWTKNAADLCVKDTITGSTGRIGPNLQLMLTDNAANITEACTGATFQYFQPINVCNLAGESSMQTNITASTDA